MASIEKQLKNYRLVTANIFYHLPDFNEILQEFIWQEYDLAPKFPELRKFLDFWEREIEGKIHSVYIAKKDIITPGNYQQIEWQGTIQ